MNVELTPRAAKILETLETENQPASVLIEHALEEFAKSEELRRRLEQSPGPPCQVHSEEELRAALEKGMDDVEAGRVTVLQNEEELSDYLAKLGNENSISQRDLTE